MKGTHLPQQLAGHGDETHRQIPDRQVEDEDVDPGRPLPVPRPGQHQHDDGVPHGRERHHDGQRHHPLDQLGVPHGPLRVHGHVAAAEIVAVELVGRRAERRVEVVDGVLGGRGDHDDDGDGHPDNGPPGAELGHGGVTQRGGAGIVGVVLISCLNVGVG